MPILPSGRGNTNFHPAPVSGLSVRRQAAGHALALEEIAEIALSDRVVPKTHRRISEPEGDLSVRHVLASADDVLDGVGFTLEIAG